MKNNKNRNGVYFDQNGVFHGCILHIERKKNAKRKTQNAERGTLNAKRRLQQTVSAT
jgi:hypothetical protein